MHLSFFLYVSFSGNKLSYPAFLHALAKCGMAVYRDEPNHRQALGMFVYNYILNENISAHAPIVELPYGIDVVHADLVLEGNEVIQFMQR